MVKNDRILFALLQGCTVGVPEDWYVNLDATDFTSKLSPEEEVKWSKVLVNGHIHLLADGGYVEVRGSSECPSIVRVTLAGHELYEKLAKSIVMKDNPFLR